MRCLTLAEKLRQSGARVSFVCRELPGNLCAVIGAQGFKTARLAAPDRDFVVSGGDVAHAPWLGVDWRLDAEETGSVVTAGGEGIDWLVVDHYALDKRWEAHLRPAVRRIMVIDDLADRRHDCDLLLDQNLVEGVGARYAMLLPNACKQLLGPRYALLRPEFSANREQIFAQRDAMAQVERLLVTLGGMDPDDVTSMVLDGIDKACFDGAVDVVMGENAPHLEAVRRRAASMTATVKVHVATRSMAELMGKADLAVGAGGVTSWERCALGLPSIVITTAKNQEPIAASLARLGAAKWLGTRERVDSSLLASELRAFARQREGVQAMSRVARRLCDGGGAGRVVEEIIRPERD